MNLINTAYQAVHAPVALSREAIGMSRVLVVGDVMLDRYWFGDVDRISPEAPVPVVHVKRNEERLGGAANVALNATSLGAQTGLLCVLGQDEPGSRVVELLKAHGVTAFVTRDEALSTTIKLRIMSRQQQLLRVDFENLPTHEVLLAVLDQYKRLIAQYDVVLLSDYAKGGLTHVQPMIDAAREAGKRVLVDPKGNDYIRYRGASILTPNRAELQQVVGQWRSESDLAQRAQKLRTDLQLEALLLTRSEEGMSLFTDTGVLHVPAQAREVFDVSGAGDTVIATLAASLGAGLSLHDAVVLANRAGSIVVGKLGTATVSHSELFLN